MRTVDPERLAESASRIPREICCDTNIDVYRRGWIPKASLKKDPVVYFGVICVMLQRLRDFIKTTRMNVSLIVIVATVYIIDYPD